MYKRQASNGSVNSMHDSYTPLGGMVPMLLMQLGEVIFGGTGCGLYGICLLYTSFGNPPEQLAGAVANGTFRRSQQPLLHCL